MFCQLLLGNVREPNLTRDGSKLNFAITYAVKGQRCRYDHEVRAVAIRPPRDVVEIEPRFLLVRKKAKAVNGDVVPLQFVRASISYDDALSQFVFHLSPIFPRLSWPPMGRLRTHRICDRARSTDM